jgi:hypothetical protein
MDVSSCTKADSSRMETNVEEVDGQVLAALDGSTNVDL